MKAVVFRGKDDVVVEDVPKPPLKPDEVMVRVTDCGICGSDVRYLHGENPWMQETMGIAQPNPPNIIPGHEVAGVVDEVGDGADKSLLGKRVAVLSFRVDGTCYWCRRGETQLCPNTRHLGHSAGWREQQFYYGGMAEYVPVWAENVFPLPDHVPTQNAALLDPFGVVVHAVEKSMLRTGESTLVMGTGVIGLLAVQTLRIYGATRIICADIVDLNLQKGLLLGADVAVNVKSGSLKDAVDSATDGIGARVIIDSVGRPTEELLPALARGGRLVTLVVRDKEEQLNQITVAGERQVMSSANFRYEDYTTSMSLLYSGRVQMEPLITHKFPIADAVHAFEVAENKDKYGAIKVIIEPGAGTE